MNEPSNASSSILKSSSSVQEVLDTNSPGLSSRNLTWSSANLSVKSVSSGLDEENSLYVLESFKNSSCFSSKAIGLKISAGRSYNVVVLENVMKQWLLCKFKK